jgi:RpiB/LacA/LacB family sugar-phosphate isomerase
MDHRGVCFRPVLIDFFRRNDIDYIDHGTGREEPVDYPVYVRPVVRDILEKNADCGVLVCGTGTGMAMAANRFCGIRAAVAVNEKMAELSRRHGHANVLCLGSRWVSGEGAVAILEVFFSTKFEGGRHARRIALLDKNCLPMKRLQEVDPQIFASIGRERRRQEEHLELIASENFTSEAVLEAAGSVLTNKYAEGYPGYRYYGGCEFVDEVEQIARHRALQLFGAEHANVQPHSGTQANLAVYGAILRPGDRILTMSLVEGGHLTHGHSKNLSGMLYAVTHYGTDSADGFIDYRSLEELAESERPKLITVGASAHPRTIDFERVADIAHRNGALVLADIAHIAGLVVTGLHPSPLPHCDFVTSTTHKTLRGPRGGIILCKKEFAKAVDGSVFPGNQGGPLMHIIAAKAVCFLEALQPSFRAYQELILRNARALARSLLRNGFHLVSGGTDNHLLLIDLRKNLPEMDGLRAQRLLEGAHISTNRNTVPGETRSSFSTSGLRLGTPALSSRAMGEAEMEQIGDWIGEILTAPAPEDRVLPVRDAVRALCRRFPLPYAHYEI